MNSHKQITIKDIARDLNLAVSTVSRAFSPHASCHPETRRRILDYAKSIGYTPNSAAKALVTRKTGKIAFVTHTFENKIFRDLIPELFQLAAQNEYDLQLNLAPPDSELEEKLITNLTSRTIDGAIIYTPRFKTPVRLVDRLTEERLPIVLLDHSGYPSCTSICRNFKVSAQAITTYLIKKKHRKIAFVYDIEDDPRKDGFLETVRKNNIPEKNITCCLIEKNQPVEALVERMLLTHQPDAVFAAYDKIAQRILRYLKQRQIEVPGEIALASTGNESYADLLDPPLTSYELHHSELSTLLMQALLERIENPDTPGRSEYLDGYLVPRHSA